MNKNKFISPVVKWVGGKRQLLKDIEQHIPTTYSRYFEPFLGGGAVLFHLQPKNAVVNDQNSELINLYSMIKDFPEELIADLKQHENEEDYFYNIRSLDREQFEQLSNIKKASRIIFLNKTCFNGLFRVNSSGEFNTPFGRYKNPNIINEVTIKAISNYFIDNNIKILNCDYQKSLFNIRKGAFIYFDPPYDPISDSSSFTGYTKNGFNRGEQERLKEVCDTYNSKGIKFLLSNSSTDFIKNLYKDYNIHTVSAKRNINSKGDGRGCVQELLIKNYE